MESYYPVLTFAGVDPSGGAGLLADVKTMSALGVYAMGVVTALTAQNTTGVSMVDAVDPAAVQAQIDMVFEDIPPLAVKIGMLHHAEIISAVAQALRRNGAENIVLDPVMVSTSGAALIDDDALSAMVCQLFPQALLVTPNRAEALRLADTGEIPLQAERLHLLGARNLLLKGGDGDTGDLKTDYLSVPGEPLIPFGAPAVETRNDHGTGCTLSSAIAAYLALGCDLISSVKNAKEFVTRALEAGKGAEIGRGHGSVNHLFAPEKLKTRKIR